MKVSYTGTHGTGKTTSVLSKAYEMKLSFPDKDITVFMENAKHSPYPINKNGTLESQMWIFTNQMQHEIYLTSKYDVVICDRSVVDAIAYTYFVNKEAAEHMLQLAKYHVPTYDVIYFKTLANNDYLYENGVRDAEDRLYREGIERKLLEFYDKLLKMGCDMRIEYV
jgi:predicted ATPase